MCYGKHHSPHPPHVGYAFYSLSFGKGLLITTLWFCDPLGVLYRDHWDTVTLPGTGKAGQDSLWISQGPSSIIQQEVQQRDAAFRGPESQAHLILRKILSRSFFISTSVLVWCRNLSFICCMRTLDRLLKLSSISLVFSNLSSLQWGERDMGNLSMSFQK